MIEISHAQARHLASAQIDELNLPEAQWAALHAHLENCPECTAYRASLRRQERDLRRGLRDRWLPVDGPHPATGEIVLAARGAALAWRAAYRKAGAGVLGLVLLLMAWMGWQSQIDTRPQAAAPVVASATPVPTPTATPIPTYKGQIVYHAPGVGGEMDIFLLNSGVDPVNLTDNPASDIFPTWSPDGEWLAFLSYRSGKREIWVMHISGARLTQLTDDPTVDWEGPLSWSPDGQMLALIGRRAEPGAEQTGRFPGQTQVYLIPLDGSSGPVALGYSRGATVVAFAPGAEKKLAFDGISYWNGAPVVFFLEGKNFLPVDSTIYNSGELRVRSLAWSLTGERLLVQADGPFEDGVPVRNAASSLRVVDFRLGNSGQITHSSKLLSANMPLGVVSGAGWTGIKDEYAFLMQVFDGCSNLILNSVGRQLRTFGEPINEMCVEGALPLTNWRTNNKSIVVKARRPGENIPGLYVLGFPGSGFTAERLIDLDLLAGSVQLRPQAPRLLAIDPTPARTPPQPPPAEPPGEGYADILFTTKSGDRTFIEAMRPDGTARRLLNQSVGYNGCPVWSPDRKRIAFLSSRGMGNSKTTGLYVMDAGGRGLSRLGEFSVSLPVRQCPQWSPDGAWILAAQPGKTNVVRVEDKLDERNHYWYTSRLSFHDPAWLPDGRLAIFEVIEDPLSAVVRAGRPEDLPKEGWEVNASFATWPTLFSINGPIGFSIYDFSNSGDSMVFAMSNDTPDSLTLNLSRLDGGGYFVLGRIDAGELLFTLPQSIRRLPDGSVALVYRGFADSQFKTAVYLYDMQTGEVRWLARLPDALLEAHWSADGRYVMLNTEGGLWALDIPAAQRGEAGPVWIAYIGTESFSWEE